MKRNRHTACSRFLYYANSVPVIRTCFHCWKKLFQNAMPVFYLHKAIIRIFTRTYSVYRGMRGSVFTCCTLLAVLLLLVGCSKQGVPSDANRQPMPPSSAQLSYLALGDSYTIGESVAVHERFPHLTVALLREQGLSINDPVYKATTGWTTANLLAALENENISSPFDVVSLLIGVNDQYQRLDSGGYRMRFTQLLQKAIALAGNRRSRVFVLSIPDYSATPFVREEDKQRVRTEIDLFNAINKEVTLSYGVHYTDITPLTREAATDGSLLAHDRLHYSAKAHAQWAERLAPEMKKVLE
jgi:lysophospholipase L1-like esterase